MCGNGEDMEDETVELPDMVNSGSSSMVNIA